MIIFGRQPAFWIGLAVSLVLGAVQTLAGNGLISDALQGRITDLVNATAQLLTLLAPLAAGLLIRPTVTPIAAPALPAGTEVTVITPDDAPNPTVVLAPPAPSEPSSIDTTETTLVYLDALADEEAAG